MNAAPRPSALVLAGGGALGAYEAGVLRYALDVLPQKSKCVPEIQIFSGTSVGALNASFLAAHADHLSRGARQLAAFWGSVTFERLLKFGVRELSGLVQLVLGRAPNHASYRRPHQRRFRAPHPPVAGLFDTSPLYDKMRVLIPWQQLNHLIDAGRVGGLALCATEICTARSVIFYRTAPTFELSPGRDPAKQLRRVEFGVEHALASAAIPFLFPSVQVQGTCYTDGALRQNTPLNPALRMGAARVLVISLTQDPHAAARVSRLGCQQTAFPGALFLLGRTIKALMSQSLDYELNRIQMYNRLIDGGIDAYGDGFLDEINQIMGPPRNAHYRKIMTCHIRPSVNLDALAVDALQQAPHELRIPGLAGSALSRLLTWSSLVESEILGLMMFTPTFVRSLLRLGYADAAAHHDELCEFFGSSN